MPFGRLHEEAAGDSKLLALSDAAWRMWGMGLIYCQKNLTDGFIPAGAIFVWGIRAKQPHRTAEELCTPQVSGKAALWEHAADGYQVHDYLQWNDSKDDILKGRAEGKERIRRWRENDRIKREELECIASRVGEQNGSRNALQDASRTRSDVVRGTWDLKKEEDPEKTRTPRSGGSVLAGALPREHLTHVLCDPTFSRCVPSAVHAKLKNLLAPRFRGDREQADTALRAWYPTVWAALAEDFVMGEAFKFWQSRFDPAFASTDGPVSGARTPAPNVDSTAEYLRKHRAGGQ